MAQAFAEAFNSGDVESVLAFYESNAVMMRKRENWQKAKLRFEMPSTVFSP
jgi:hypothetical protein